MDLPSTRELELEVLLREKDTQLTEVTDEIRALRQYLAKQPGPSKAEPITLPPALMSVLIPHINNAVASTTTAANTSSTVTSALTQRVRLLQDENDELYELLKKSETGRLKDEVRALKRVVGKLETALKDSHQVITSLSTELDKAYEVITTSSKQVVANTKTEQKRGKHSQSPSYPDSAGTGSNSRPPPTEPRAHKRPRLSETHPSPPPAVAPTPAFSKTTSRPVQSLSQKPHGRHQNSNGGVSSRGGDNSRNNDSTTYNTHSRGKGSAYHSGSGSAKTDMDMDLTDDRANTSSSMPPQRERNREREPSTRDRERDRGRDTGRQHGVSKHSGHSSNTPRRSGHTQPHSQAHPSSGGTVSGGLSVRGASNAQARKASERNSGSANESSRSLQERLGLRVP